jgi:integrase
LFSTPLDGKSDGKIRWQTGWKKAMTTQMTNTAIKALDKAGKYHFGDGLYLNVSVNGTKSWIQRFRYEGKRMDRGLGSWPRVSTRDAKRLATQNRVQLDQGINPWANGKTAKALNTTSTAPTFRESAHKALAVIGQEWRSDKVRTNWLQQMERHAFPVFGNMAIDEITRADVVDFISGLQATKGETARKMHQRIRSVFGWAVGIGYIEMNPAGDAIKNAIRKHAGTKESYQSLRYQDVAAAIETIRDSNAQLATRRCFEFMILTASRGGEVRLAEWSEIDWIAKLWTIPAEHAKDGRGHSKPLSIQAMVLLQEVREKLGGEGLIFAMPGGKRISENTLSDRARKDNLGCVPHGFRSSFKTWATETNQHRTATEFCLSHNPFAGVEGVYMRSDLTEAQAVIFQDWADYLSPLPF